MPTKLHSQLSGADLHPNKVDGTTGTELTPASEAVYDARWKKRADDTSATTTDTVTNTTTETNFAQTRTLAANALTVGRTFRVTAFGVYGTTASAQAFTLKLKFGSTVLATTGSNNLSASLTNRGWKCEALITCLSTGVSGTVECQGYGGFSSAASSTVFWDMENTAAITVDTTQAQTLQLSAQWAGANAANTISLRQLVVEPLG